MPILGIIASAITGRLVTNSYESIATVTVGSGGSSSITFSSIPSTYKHLQVRHIAYGTSGGVNIWGTFNNDTGNNYARHYLYGDGTSAAASGNPSYPYLNFGYMQSSSGYFAAGITDILDYTSVTKNKTTKTLTGVDTNGGGLILMYSGAYFINTTAISSIQIFPQTGTFSQYSQFALYGIKGA